MRTTATLLLGMLALASAACGKKETGGDGKPDGPAPPEGTGAELLKTSRDVAQGPGGAWEHNLNTDKAGDVVFRVTSEGPCTVTLITKKGYLMMRKLGRDALPKSEVLFAAETPSRSHEGRVTLPAGQVWFIIENRWTSNALIRLQCFEGH